MFCPDCGQRQLSEETMFCSSCGLSLTSVKELIYQNRQHQNFAVPENKAISPRLKGVKQGGQLMVLGLMIVPLIVIFSIILNLHPTLAVFAAVVTFWGGILRMVYALLFESKYPSENNCVESNLFKAARKFIGGKTKSSPEPQTISVSSYAPPIMGNWRNTNDLIQPLVTENKTQFIKNDD